MKKLAALLALFTGIAASAASVTVTIPSTTLSDVSTIVGSFTYDTTTSAVSNINITAAGNVDAGAYTVLGVNVRPGSFFYVRKTGAAGAELNSPELLIFYTGASIPAGGGAAMLNSINTGTCTAETTGCVALFATRIGFADNVPVTVTVSAPPAPVPTLSEWAIITFAMVIVGFGVYQQRRRQLYLADQLSAQKPRLI
jgi:hypothetical protein